MADFCKACSIEIFGEDSKDLAGLGATDAAPLEPGYGYTVICEGCGFILVNDLGECIVCDLMEGKEGHGRIPAPKSDASTT